MNDKKLHVVMFPWLAFGHMVPYLELSKLIVQKGHTVSFISTPRNIHRLLPRLPENLSSAVRFVEIPLPRHENLPDGAEATTDLPINLVPFLKLSFDGLQEAVSVFLETSKPDWVLHDFAPYWLPAIARRLGIPSGFFSAFTAATLTLVKPPGFDDDRKWPEGFLSPPKWVPFPTNVAFKPFEIPRDADSFCAEEHGNVPDSFRASTVLESSDIIAVRSSLEYEPEWLNLLGDLYRKPVMPVGVLPPDQTTSQETDTWQSIKAWLDKQKTGSIVYVAFGSEAKLSQTELTEIALGLELSGLPFFWVLKTRRGEWDTEPVDLPEGFEERTKERGMVWRGWVEQPRVLSHDSIGLLLTHTGWGTVIEAIGYHKPMVMLVFLYDQGLNARVLEEKKIGYMVPRDEIEGSFTKEDVAKSLRLVMVEEEGKVYRDIVKDMNGICGDQDLYLTNFLDYLVAHTRTQKLMD